MSILEATKSRILNNEMRLKGEFESDGIRTTLIDRCERYAGWTLPSIFPDEDIIEDDEMQNDFQSVGAQAVTNLANKVMMALFQPSRPFFRAQLSTQQRIELEDTGLTSADVDKALSKLERDSMKLLNKMNARVVMNDTVEQLIVTGNSLMYMPEDVEEKMLTYSIKDYLIKRSLRGEMVKIIIKECKVVSGLPDNIKTLARQANYRDTDEVAIYTGIELVGKDRYFVWQELEDLWYCHEQEGWYNKSDLPWIPLTWRLTRGKDYGTGLVENYAGDFSSLSSTAEAILDYTTIVTDIKTLVNPAGQTDVKEIAQAKSGAYVYGKEEDLFVHTANTGQAADFLNARFDNISRRIASAFLLTSQVTRDAERVTAEEIRQQAHELESSLGGVYSRLASELQLPLATRLMAKVDETFSKIEPVIVTGFESLSRNSDLDNMRAFMNDLAIFTNVPDDMKFRMNLGEVMKVLGAGHGIDYDKFMKDEDQVKSETQERIALQAQASGMEAKAVEQGKGQGQQ